MSVRFVCRPCRKAYRLPDGTREFPCKQCGETLAPADPADARDDDARKEELRRVNAELKRWRKTLEGLKAYCIVAPAITLSLYALIVGVLLLTTGAQTIGLVVLASLFGFGLLAFSLYGLADRRPVPAIAVFATVMTLSFLVNVLIADFTSPTTWIGSTLMLLFCIAAWCAIPRAIRGQELMAAYPDAFRRKEDWERARVQGESVRERGRARARRGRKSESRVALWILGGAAVVAALVAGGVWYARQPTDPAPVLQAFRVDWEAGNLDGIAGVANSDSIARNLRRYWERQDWIEAPPELQGWEQTVAKKDRVRCNFLLADGRISDTRWLWVEEGEWRLIAFGLPQAP